MDRTWLSKPTFSPDYQAGINEFIEFVKNKNPEKEKILCPCAGCSFVYLHTFADVKDHLVSNGFVKGYSTWHYHGESYRSFLNDEEHDFPPPQLDEQMNPATYDIDNQHDEMRTMIDEAFGIHGSPLDDEGDEGASSFMETDSNDKEKEKMKKLVDDANEELYKGCKTFSRLSFIIRLFHMKCINGWSASSFSMLMNLLNEAFPDCNLPIDSYATKKYMKSFGLNYEKIHACPKDCILYRGDFANQQSCHVCGTSRYESSSENKAQDEEEEGVKKKRKHDKPAKVLRYFPLIPRLQRLFLSSKTSSDMRWHSEVRTDDGILRHPADSKVWKSFNEQYPDFALDPRNVRLGLASDGFNPFKRGTYTTWPVILIPYNMPPWIDMKQSSFILSMIIPGKKGPGNDIDVYLEPLIEELNQLWVGVDTYDATSGETFNMRAQLLWTINDFPAYAMLSGQTTKGKFACPVCEESTDSRWLPKGGKYCYMGHRRWLDRNHEYRFQKDLFDGTEEHRAAPTPLTGSDVLQKVSRLSVTYGKGPKVRKRVGRKRKRQDDASEVQENVNPNDEKIYKKMCALFKLPYWNLIRHRHNIDFMHVERNVGVNFVGTMLGVKGVTKDNDEARDDLVELGIRHDLHPITLPNGQRKNPDACYVMSKRGKILFFKVLKGLKLPDGYASNISNLVNEEKDVLQSLKSHDYHILMQGLLPVALRRSLPTHVVKAVKDICNVFQGVCSKILIVEQLTELEDRAALALCELEKIFPPSFFTVMVHLVIHLVEEAILAGPVLYRWMYPIERFLFTLKSYIHNKTNPEASMSETYVDNESGIFCSRYSYGVETIFNRPRRNEDDLMEHNVHYLFSSGGRGVGKKQIDLLDNVAWIQAHRYVLFQHEGVIPFIDKFLKETKSKYRPRRYKDHELDRIKNTEFHSWFTRHVEMLDEGEVSAEIKSLAAGPNKYVARYKSFIHNGVKYRTKNSESHLKCQNSGILCNSVTSCYASSKDNHPVEGNVDYYGVLTDIVELDYFGDFKIVLFKADWVDVKGRGVKVDELGYTLVNFNNLMYRGDNISHEPFVISSQVQQVFYVQDPEDEDWHVAVKSITRDAYDVGVVKKLDDSRSNARPI